MKPNRIFSIVSLALTVALLSSVASPEIEEPAPRMVSPYFLGLNLSKPNDLDEIWENFDIPEHLRSMDARILRYPGGEETSRWHWDRPGVNGYVCYWNPAHRNWRWQTTWVSPEEWDTNEAFMSIDEYFAHCKAIGAEPLLGINMSSGEVMDRREDGIQMAVEMIRYVKEKGYPLKFVYMDNEPWHPGTANYYQFDPDLYAELCVVYAKAIREVMPELIVVANPFEQARSRNDEVVERFFEIAGGHVDIISLHFYWEWGQSTWDRWTSQIPMVNSSTWRLPEIALTYTEDLNNLRRTIHNLGFEDVDLAILEWNVARVREPERRPTHHQIAFMQSEMLLQFLNADVVMTTLWPVFAQVTPPWGITGEERPNIPNGGDRSIFEHEKSYSPTPSHEMFRLFRGVSGGQILHTEFLDGGQYILRVELREGGEVVIILNKAPEPFEVDMELFVNDEKESFRVERVGLDASYALDREMELETLTVPAYSLTRIQ